MSNTYITSHIVHCIISANNIKTLSNTWNNEIGNQIACNITYYKIDIDFKTRQT
jgi:hypothetical protein